MSLINEVAFTSDGSGAISVWEPKGGTLLMSFKGASVLNPHSLCLLGSDYLLGVEKGKPMIQAWPINSQEKAQIRMICPGRVSSMKASPDNCYICATIETKLHVWQIASGRLLATASGHYQPITMVKWTQDSNFIITGAEDGNVCVWQLSRLICKQTVAFGITGMSSKGGVTGVTEPLYVKSQHALPVTDIFVSRFGSKSRIVSVSHDRTCKIFDLYTGEDLLCLIFDTRLSCVTLDLTEDNAYIGTTDGKIKSFCLRQVPRTRDHHVQDSSQSTDFIGHEKTVTALSCSVNGITLLSGSIDETIKIWHKLSRQCLRTIQHKGPVINCFLTFLPHQLHQYDFNPTTLLKSFDKNLETEFEVEIYTHESLQSSVQPINNRTITVASGSVPFSSVSNNGQSKAASSSSSSSSNYDSNLEIDKLKRINKTLYEFCVSNIINNNTIKKKKKKKSNDNDTNGELEYVKQKSNLGFKGKKKLNRNKFKKQMKFKSSYNGGEESGNRLINDILNL